ncbi:MAG TPA: hypothetical protein H9695_13625 [Candidatus Mediterraneibacter excrementigallinarum]|nr:hypothetical protein [Candidatus Mediterraneibacter excrementigallinarum]
MHIDERNDDFKQNYQIKTHETVSIYDEMQRELNEIAESLLRTQKISDSSMHMSEEAVKQSNKAIILSLVSLGVTVIGAVAEVLIFLL